MVEQIRISPEEVRGYGNICEGHTLEDFIVFTSGLAKEKENVHGALTDVYKLVYSMYGLMFDFDKGAKQLYLQTNEANTFSLGFDTVNKQLYLVDENDTGFNLRFDEDTNELYITDDYGYVVFYDKATSQSKNTHWKIRSSDQSDLTVTVGTGGTTLTNASTSVSRFYFANPEDSTSDSPPITISDFVVEADILDSSFTDSDSQISFLLQGQTTSLNLKSYTAPYHIKIKKEGTSAKHYINNTLIRTTTISNRTTYYMGFQLYKRASITFRDYVIREI